MVDVFVIRCEKAPLPTSDASGRAHRHFARNSPVPGLPLLRDLIPLLFRCYSAVISPVVPLLIPLLFRRQHSESSRKYLNHRMFSRRTFAKSG
jgi:hypothetical protein